MIVYNITTKITWAIADDWLRWQQSEYVPEILSTGFFDSYHIYRLLEQDDEEGPTYITQIFTSTEERLRIFVEEFAPVLIRKSFQKWGDQFIAHRTFMELVR